jgi:hypothetical protein
MSCGGATLSVDGGGYSSITECGRAAAVSAFEGCLGLSSGAIGLLMPDAAQKMVKWSSY